MNDVEQVSDEQAADFQALADAAQGQAVMQAQAEAVKAEEQVQTLAGELSAVASIALAVLSVPYPSLAAIWTDDARQRVAESAAAVCEKHGWLSAGFMAGYGAEMALLATAGPLVVASVGAVRQDTAARKAQAPEPVQAIAAPVAGPVQVPDVPQAGASAVHIGTVQP